jgi:hypothetical protein
MLRDFATKIINTPISVVSTITDFWMMRESGSGLWIIPVALLEIG